MGSSVVHKYAYSSFSFANPKAILEGHHSIVTVTPEYRFWEHQNLKDYLFWKFTSKYSTTGRKWEINYTRLSVQKERRV